MSGFEAVASAPETKRVEFKNKLPLHSLSGPEDIACWKEGAEKTELVDEASIRAYPLDTWDAEQKRDPFTPINEEAVVLELSPTRSLKAERFDLLYAYRTMTGFEAGRVQSFFKNEAAIREKLTSLISQGRLRAATYLLRTVERYYPKRKISPRDFAAALPHYPALPVSYTNMEQRLTPETGSPPPAQDTIDFCIKEAMLADLMHLSHEIETVAASPTLSDEAKDSSLRPLRISVRDQITGLENEIHRTAQRLSAHFFQAVYFRLQARDSYADEYVADMRSWRDNEDALTAMASMVNRFDGMNMGPWEGIAKAVFDAQKVALGPKSYEKGSLRAAVDHLLDLSHHDGSIMSWLGKAWHTEDRYKDEAEELLEFPSFFFEFRRYVSTSQPAKEMTDMFDELFKLARTKEARNIYWTNALTPAEQKRYPVLARAFSQVRDVRSFSQNLVYTLDFINDEGRDRRFSKFFPPKFFRTLKEEVDRRGVRIADARRQLESLKQMYGFRAT